MDKTFIEGIVELSAPTFLEIDGLKFSDRDLQLVDTDYRPDVLPVATLTAVRDYVIANVDDLQKPKLMLHVKSPDAVSLITEASGSKKKRTIFLEARLPEKPFPFEQFMEAEAFIILLQTRFAAGGTLAEIKKLAGNMKSEQVITFADDGITQHVTARSGAATVEDVKVPNPVELAPFRTFREIEQPESLFVFRVRDGGNGKPPGFALFEADGGAWKLTAIQAIKDWLTENVEGIAVIG